MFLLDTTGCPYEIQRREMVCLQSRLKDRRDTRLPSVSEFNVLLKALLPAFQKPDFLLNTKIFCFLNMFSLVVPLSSWIIHSICKATTLVTSVLSPERAPMARSPHPLSRPITQPHIVSMAWLQQLNCHGHAMRHSKDSMGSAWTSRLVSLWKRKYIYSGVKEVQYVLLGH